MSDTCVFLHSSLATDQIQVVNSRRLEDALISKKIKYDKIDGSFSDNHEIRQVLFDISQQRGKYPQCFIKTSVDNNNTYHFIGLWDEIESLIECDTLPIDILDSNPQIKTFTRVFENVIRI